MEKVEAVKRAAHRPLGSPNKASAKTRAILQLVVENSAVRIQEELDSIHGKDYIAALATLAEFVLPKLNRVEVTDGEDGPRIVRVIHSLQPIAPAIEDVPVTILSSNKPF